jgi:chromate transporter
VGYKVRGFGGALAAVLGIVVPSFTMILLIALLFADIRYNPWVDAAFKGMRPAVVALIVMPILALSKTVHRLMWIAIVATALAIHWLGWSPILLLVAGGLVGIGYELWNAKRLDR